MEKVLRFAGYASSNILPAVCFVLYFYLNGSLTRVHLQGLKLWALLEVATSLWPRKVGLKGLF